MIPTNILMVEINEITWTLIDPFIKEGKLPTFALLKREGTWGAPLSVDLRPQLDPWITWTTLYSGRSQRDHNVYFLQQAPDTIRAKRIWEICDEANLPVGVYGSLCSWPPRKVKGFYIPDTFSPDTATWPESLAPIQEMNLSYTRGTRLASDEDGLGFKIKLGSKLLRLGLSPATLAALVHQMAREQVTSSCRWQRAALQPRVNFDFFSRLYRRYRPRFASFHTNHVAHYQHTYWKAMQPEVFRPLETSEEEIRAYGRAIEYGYRTADWLLKRVLGLVDRNTVLVVASSMGQQPYHAELQKGKQIQQVRSLDRLLAILGVDGQARAVSMMADQFNIYSDDPKTLDAVRERLQAAYVDDPARPMFFVYWLDGAVTASLRGHNETTADSKCFFPNSPGQSTYRYEDLVYNSGLVKSGCHHPQGMIIFYGAGIERGGELPECNNLDIAPTLLTLLDLPVPREMQGRVMNEAFASPARATRAS